MTQKRKSRQLWKSGLYRSLFFSYVIVLLVPILVSPLVLYGAGDAITRQVDHANETSLTLLRDAVDAQLSEIYTASSYLLIHEAAWRLKQKEHFTSDDTADLRLLQSMLKQFIGQSPIIADIYLCFPLADAVLSKKDLTYGQGFAYTAQTELGMDYARWKEELGFSGRRKHLIVGDHENKARQHLLIYHQYNRITNEGVSPLVIVTNVNLDMLRGLLRDYGQGGAASFSIENGDAAISDGSASAEPMPLGHAGGGTVRPLGIPDFRERIVPLFFHQAFHEAFLSQRQAGNIDILNLFSDLVHHFLVGFAVQIAQHHVRPGGCPHRHHLHGEPGIAQPPADQGRVEHQCFDKSVPCAAQGPVFVRFLHAARGELPHIEDQRFGESLNQQHEQY